MHKRRHFLRAAAASPLLVLLPHTRARAAAATSTFTLEREGDGFAVEAQALVPAARELAWSILVDYPGLERFVPGMRASRVLSRDGSRLVVRQQGAARFGPFSEAFDITLAVQEQAPQRVDAQVIDGDFIAFRSHYRLEALDGLQTRLSYRAHLQPRRAPPPLVGVPVMRRVARLQFEALIAEIERRAGVAREQAARLP
jgi:ribosome-associated toxin RatA of RatAB toxin-antitoxin module